MAAPRLVLLDGLVEEEAQGVVPLRVVGTNLLQELARIGLVTKLDRHAADDQEKASGSQPDMGAELAGGVEKLAAKAAKIDVGRRRIARRRHALEDEEALDRLEIGLVAVAKHHRRQAVGAPLAP